MSVLKPIHAILYYSGINRRLNTRNQNSSGFFRIYGRIEKRAGGKRKIARHASKTGKAGTNCIFFQKSGLVMATREAREGGEGNRREKGRGFFSLSVYSSFCDVFEAGKRWRIWEK